MLFEDAILLFHFQNHGAFVYTKIYQYYIDHKLVQDLQAFHLHREGLLSSCCYTIIIAFYFNFVMLENAHREIGEDSKKLKYF